MLSAPITPGVPSPLFERSWCHLSRSKTYTRINKIHYLKLILRSLLLVGAIALYLHDPTWFASAGSPSTGLAGFLFLAIVWIVFVPEMIRRFFPNDDESAGCQKQFSRNYQPRTNTTLSEEIARILGRTREEIQKKDFRDALVCALLWIALNATIGVLYVVHLIDAGILIIISMFYAVADIICILFWCPFQTLIMKNTCCAQCRIYNWDYVMMFTPLVFIGGVWSLSLFLCGLALLVKWEVDYYRHPDRFAQETNAYLSCEGCGERLCSHKASVQRLLKEKTHALAQARAQAHETLDRSKDPSRTDRKV